MPVRYRISLYLIAYNVKNALFPAETDKNRRFPLIIATFLLYLQRIFIYSDSMFTIDQGYAKELQNKLEAYQELSKDKRTLHLVMVTTNGVTHNSYYNMIQKEITIDDLFA